MQETTAKNATSFAKDVQSHLSAGRILRTTQLKLLVTVTSSVTANVEVCLTQMGTCANAPGTNFVSWGVRKTVITSVRRWKNVT
jgi:hypothetical protein